MKKLRPCGFLKFETRNWKLSRLFAVSICSIAFIFIGAIDMQSQVATGTPPFGSFAGGPEDINLADLNSHWGFGITGKAGRGLGFGYTMGFDNRYGRW